MAEQQKHEQELTNVRQSYVAQQTPVPMETQTIEPQKAIKHKTTPTSTPPVTSKAKAMPSGLNQALALPPPGQSSSSSSSKQLSLPPPEVPASSSSKKPAKANEKAPESQHPKRTGRPPKKQEEGFHEEERKLEGYTKIEGKTAKRWAKQNVTTIKAQAALRGHYFMDLDTKGGKVKKDGQMVKQKRISKPEYLQVLLDLLGLKLTG